MSLFRKQTPQVTPEQEIAQPILMGEDLGYGQVKLMTDGKCCKFLSAVGTPISDFGRVTTIASTAELLDTLSVTLENGQRYYVGHNAVVNTRNGRINLKQNKAENNDNKIKFLTSLALLTEEDSNYNEFIVVTGLPVLEYKNQKDQLSNMMFNLGRPFEFTMNYGSKEVKKTLKVKDVKIISQGEGAFYDYILDEKGDIIPERADEVQGTIMVVDPGYKTTDIVTMENGRYVEILSDQFNKGASQIHQEVLRLIMQRLNIKKELKDMDKIVRTGIVFHNMKEYNVKDIIELAARPFAEDIVDNLINLSNDQLGSMQKIILTGGGSAIVYPYIKELLNGVVDVIMMDEAEYCNTSGYYKYGKLLEKSGAFK